MKSVDHFVQIWKSFFFPLLLFIICMGAKLEEAKYIWCYSKYQSRWHTVIKILSVTRSVIEQLIIRLCRIVRIIFRGRLRPGQRCCLKVAWSRKHVKPPQGPHLCSQWVLLLGSVSAPSVGGQGPRWLVFGRETFGLGLKLRLQKVFWEVLGEGQEASHMVALLKLSRGRFFRGWWFLNLLTGQGGQNGR